MPWHLGERFDSLWPRLARAAGLGLGLVEYAMSQQSGRPVDAAVLAFAGALVALPTVLKDRSG